MTLLCRLIKITLRLIIIYPVYLHDPVITAYISSRFLEVLLPFDLTLDKGHEFFMLDLAALHVDLEGQKESKRALVRLVQTPNCVLEHLEGHVLDDVRDTAGGNRRLSGPETTRLNSYTPWGMWQYLMLGLGTLGMFNIT